MEKEKESFVSKLFGRKSCNCGLQIEEIDEKEQDADEKICSCEEKELPTSSCKESSKKECCCGNEEVKLVYACSGRADVGALSDGIARKLAKEGYAKMSCLAGVGADISGFIVSAQNAECNITIDGCPLRCAAKTLENRGVKPIAFILTELGFVKGSTAVNERTVDDAISILKRELKLIRSETQSNSDTKCC